MIILNSKIKNMATENKKSPPPDRSINKEPNTSTGQHEPDIQDEKLKRKRGNGPQRRTDISPKEFPNDNPEEYNDGAPVE